jgi:anti-sigma regulatory factor (Ser/Thr protein kinase)
MAVTITVLKVPEVRSYRLIAPNAPDAAKVARDHLSSLLRSARSLVPIDVAMLLVSELVTNTFRHSAASTVCVTTTIQPRGVHVEVYDTDPTRLPTTAADPAVGALAENGRGLRMVQLLAARWDWELCGGEQPVGKAVWFELLHQPETGYGRR